MFYSARAILQAAAAAGSLGNTISRRRGQRLVCLRTNRLLVPSPATTSTSCWPNSRNTLTTVSSSGWRGGRGSSNAAAAAARSRTFSRTMLRKPSWRRIASARSTASSIRPVLPAGWMEDPAARIAVSRFHHQQDRNSYTSLLSQNKSSLTTPARTTASSTIVATALEDTTEQHGEERRSARRGTATPEDVKGASSVKKELTQRISRTTTTEKEPHRLSLPRIYRYFELESFSQEEMEAVFDRIHQYSKISDDDNNNPHIDQTAIQMFLRERIRELEQQADGETVPPHVVQDGGDEQVEKKDASLLLLEQTRNEFAKCEARQLLQLLLQRDDLDHLEHSCSTTLTISKSDFVHRLTAAASAIDYRRTAPVILSMLLVGSSVGVITPAMPFIVQSLHLTASQYGAAVSAFALSKMLGNIPAAIAVERHGRKPYMTYSLAVIAAGVGGIGLAANFEQLWLCRFLTGAGVAALSTAGTLMVADLSTPRNRASTYAPVMSAFAAGTALGPAVGGYLVDHVGLHATFYCVGASFLGVALLNDRVLLEETKPTGRVRFPWQPMTTTEDERPTETTTTNATKDDPNSSTGSSTSATHALRDAVGQWGPLLRDPAVRSVLVMNGVYWIALAGSQMTLLPLLLTAPDGLNFTATQVGQVYMGMSAVQIVGNPIFGKISDTIGKAPVIVGATTLIGGAMACLPYCCSGSSESLLPLVATLGLWSVGSSMLSTAPLAYISDKVDEAQRAQAIALLRTCGDVGFLVGATGTGALADWAGSLDVAVQSSAALLLSATVWFAARQVLSARLAAAAAAASK